MASALLFRRWSMSESAGAVSESAGAVSESAGGVCINIRTSIVSPKLCLEVPELSLRIPAPFLDTKVVSESAGTCLEVMEQYLKALEVYE